MAEFTQNRPSFQTGSNTLDTVINGGTLENAAPKPTTSDRLNSFGSNVANQLSPAPTPEQQTANEVEFAHQLLNSPEALQRFSAASKYNNQAGQNPVYNELLTMDFASVVEKYGPEVARNRHRVVDARVAYDEIDRDESTGGEDIKNFGVSLGQGVVSGVGGIASFGAGFLSDDLGIGASEITNNINESLNSLRSLQNLTAAEAAKVQSQLDDEEVLNQYNADSSVTSDESALTAELNRFGSTFLNRMGQMADNPEIIADTVGKGVGSLIPSVGAVKAVSAVANGTRAASIAAPAAIGITEGGGVYAQTVSEIMGMSEEDLTLGSQAYNDLRASGVDHETAQKQIANNAGLMAGSKQTVIGGVAGKFVEGFESNPLARTSVSNAASNIVSQGVEEAFQSGTGEINANVAINRFADSSRGALDNVGNAVADGVVGGVGMAAATSAPSIVLDGTSVAIGSTAEAVGKIIDYRVNSIDAKIDAEDPTSAVNRDKNVEVVQALQTTMEASDEPEAQQVGAEFARIMQVDQEAFAASSDNIKKWSTNPEAEGQETAVDQMVNLLNTLDDGGLTPQEEKEAVVHLYKQVMDMQEFATQDLPENIDALPDDNPIKQALVTGKETVNAIAHSAVFHEAFMRSRELPDQETVSEVDQSVADESNVLIQVDPSTLDPETVSNVLSANQEGKLDLTPDQVKNLKVASETSSILRENQKVKESISEEAKVADETFNKDSVTRDIHLDGHETKHGTGRSINDYTRDILTSIIRGGEIVNRQGETVDAQSSMNGLGNFAQHMVNKINALNEATQSGNKNKVSYRTLLPSGDFVEATDLNARSINSYVETPNGLATAKLIHSDAVAVARIYNAMLSEHGSILKGEPVTVPDIITEPAQEKTETEDSSVVDDDDVNVQEAPENEAESVSEPEPEIKEETSEPETKAEPEDTGRKIKIKKHKKFNGPKSEHRKITDVNTSPDLVEDLGKVDTSEKFATLHNETKADIMGWIEPVFEKLDLNVSEYISDIVLIDNDTKAEEGIFFWNSNVLGLNNYILENIDSAESQHVLAHELFHAIDNKARNRLKSKLMPSSKALKLNDNQLFNEIMEAIDQNPEWAETYFEYALSFEDVDTRNTELFAELGALTHTHPNLVEELIPNAGQLIEWIIRTGKGEPVSDQTGETQEGTESQSGDGSEGVKQRIEETIKRIASFPTLDRVVKFVRGKSKLESMTVREAIEDSGEPEEIRERMERVIKKYIPDVNKAMNARLNLKWDKDTTMIDGLKSGKIKDISRRTKALSIVDTRIGKYDSNLLGKASLAAISWFIEQSIGSSHDKERIAKILNVEESVVTDDMVESFRNGESSGVAKQEIGRRIMDFWGVTPNRDAPDDLAVGVAEGIAAELITVLSEMKLVDAREIGFKVTVDEKTHDRLVKVVRFDTDAMKNIAGAFKGHTDAFAKAILSEPNTIYYLNGKKPKTPETQLRQRAVPLSQIEKDVAEIANNVVFKPNIPMIAVYDSLGKERLAKLIGAVDPRGRRFNKNDRKSIDGKNNSINSSLDKLSDMLEAINSSDTDINDTEIRYQHEFIKSGRLMMRGFNPQSDKIARAMFKATNSVLDLSDPASEDSNLFWLSVGQNADIVSIEKQAVDISVQETQEKIRESYGPIIEMLERNIAEDILEMSSEDYAVFTDTLDGEVATMELIQALMTVAMYDHMTKTDPDSLKEFDHFLSIEADGVTDGPINAIVHFSTKGLTKGHLDILRMGGYFVNDTDTSMNDHRTVVKNDLYTLGASIFEGNMKEFFGEIRSNHSGIGNSFGSMMNVLSSFGDIEYDQDTQEISIGRNTMKNPLTVKGYGSGTRSIAEKIAKEYTGEVYKLLTEVMNDYAGRLEDHPIIAENPSLLNDIGVMFNSKALYSSKNDSFFLKGSGNKINFGNLEKFTFTDEQMDSFTTNMMTMMMPSMESAISDMFLGANDNMRIAELMTNIQSIVYKDIVEQAVEAETKKQIAEGKLHKGGQLSRNDFDKIMKDNEKYAAIITDGEQTVNLSLTEKRVSSEVISSDLLGKHNDPRSRQTPQEAGVKVSATFTQNRGDAHMILHAIKEMHERDLGTNMLHVFDGIELSMGNIKEMSRMINEVVYQGWMKNPYSDVHTSFESFMKLNPMSKIGTDSKKKIFESLSKSIEGDGLDDKLKNLIEQSTEINRAITDKKNVLSTMDASVDHMASIGEPYVATGSKEEIDFSEGLTSNAEEIIDDNDILFSRMRRTRDLSDIAEITNPDNKDRIQSMINKITGKLDTFVREDDSLKTKRSLNEVSAIKIAIDLSASGFSMTPHEQEGFVLMHSAMEAEMKLDKGSLVRMGVLYQNIMKNLNKASFLPNKESMSPDQLALAQSKLDALTAIRNEPKFTGMATVMALSQVNEEFRSVLSEMATPKGIKTDKTSLDAYLTSMANKGLNQLTTIVSGEKARDVDVRRAMDSLAKTFIAQEERSDALLIEYTNNKINDIEAHGAGLISKAGKAIGEYADKKAYNSRGLKSAIFKTGSLVSGLLDADRGKIVADQMISLTNNTDNVLMKPFRSFLKEVIGITDDDKVSAMLVNKVRYAVSSIRQDYRITLPKVINSRFSRKLTKVEHKALLDGLAKTDIAALGNGMSIKKVLAAIKNEKALDAELVTLNQELDSLVPNVNALNLIKEKSDQLSTYMTSGIAGNTLLRNAHAIAFIVDTNTNAGIDVKAVSAVVDKIVSLQALKKVDQGTKDTLKNLADTESDGVDFAIYYLYGLRKDEIQKEHNDLGLINGYKGYIPNEAQQGVRVVIADDALEGRNLLRRGYKRVGNYKNGFESGSKGYYFTNVGGDAAYSQGAMQTVQSTYNGVDPLTGVTTQSGVVSGAITGDRVDLINRRLTNNVKKLNDKEGLIPVFNASGEVIAYERAINPEMRERMNTKDNLSEMMGVWAGRQIEEKLSSQYNELLVDAIYEEWDKSPSDRKHEFVNIADLGDDDSAVYKDSWSTVNRQTRKYIESRFGKNTFMIRKDSIDNKIGYRVPSVSDMWTGKSDLNKDVRDTFVKTVTAIIGRDAYKFLVSAEKLVQTAVSTAKNHIIIRSVFIPALNMASNMVQLMNLGVNIKDIGKGGVTKMVEITQFLKNIDERIALEAELKTVGRKPNVKARIENRIAALDKMDEAMSIAPLIKAGEFSTISEGMTDLDESLRNNMFTDWVEAAVDKLPEGLKTVGKYGIVSEDTALYQGLSRAVQYGDFLGKAIYYDNLIKKGMSEKDALRVITEEFVNFNLLPGRTRTYLESMGLTWFQAFKIRTMKVALKMMRNNPYRSLMLTMGVPALPFDTPAVGSPLTDNFLSTWLDDRLGYSLGWGMMQNVPSLNPWYNITH